MKEMANELCDHWGTAPSRLDTRHALGGEDEWSQWLLPGRAAGVTLFVNGSQIIANYLHHLPRSATTVVDLLCGVRERSADPSAAVGIIFDEPQSSSPELYRRLRRFTAPIRGDGIRRTTVRLLVYTGDPPFGFVSAQHGILFCLRGTARVRLQASAVASRGSQDATTISAVEGRIVYWPPSYHPSLEADQVAIDEVNVLLHVALDGEPLTLEGLASKELLEGLETRTAPKKRPKRRPIANVQSFVDSLHWPRRGEITRRVLSAQLRAIATGGFVQIPRAEKPAPLSPTDVVAIDPGFPLPWAHFGRGTALVALGGDVVEVVASTELLRILRDVNRGGRVRVGELLGGRADAGRRTAARARAELYVAQVLELAVATGGLLVEGRP
jgi:hypothetical protein